MQTSELWHKQLKSQSHGSFSVNSGTAAKTTLVGSGTVKGVPPVEKSEERTEKLPSAPPPRPPTPTKGSNTVVVSGGPGCHAVPLLVGVHQCWRNDERTIYVWQTAADLLGLSALAQPSFYRGRPKTVWKYPSSWVEVKWRRLTCRCQGPQVRTGETSASLKLYSSCRC